MVQGRLLSSLARPCRIVAHRRYPPTLASSARRFHLTPKWLSSAPSDPSDSRNSPPESVAHDIPSLNSEHTPSKDAPLTSPVAPTEQVVKKDPGPYGSGVRRALRNRRQGKDLIAPIATVPQWFRERNTVLHGVEGQAVAQSQPQVEIKRLETDEKKAEVHAQSHGGDGGNPLPSETQSGTSHRYVLSEALWEELCASAKAGLRLPPPKYAQEPSAQKSHLVLQYPGADGILFLDAVVKRLAQELGADVVTLDAQDIAQLCSEQDMVDSGATSPIRSLGYEVYRPSIAESWQESGDNLNESEADDTDFIDAPVPPRNFRPGLKGAKFITISSASNNGDIPLPSILGLKSLMTSFNGPLDGTATAQSPSDRVEDRRLRLVHELISSPSKRSKQVSETESSSELRLPPFATSSCRCRTMGKSRRHVKVLSLSPYYKKLSWIGEKPVLEFCSLASRRRKSAPIRTRRDSCKMPLTTISPKCWSLRREWSQNWWRRRLQRTARCVRWASTFVTCRICFVPG